MTPLPKSLTRCTVTPDQLAMLIQVQLGHVWWLDHIPGIGGFVDPDGRELSKLLLVPLWQLKLDDWITEGDDPIGAAGEGLRPVRLTAAGELALAPRPVAHSA